MEHLEGTKAHLEIKTDLVEWFRSQTGFWHIYTCATNASQHPLEQNGSLHPGWLALKDGSVCSCFFSLSAHVLPFHGTLDQRFEKLVLFPNKCEERNFKIFHLIHFSQEFACIMYVGQWFRGGCCWHWAGRNAVVNFWWKLPGVTDAFILSAGQAGLRLNWKVNQHYFSTHPHSKGYRSPFALSSIFSVDILWIFTSLIISWVLEAGKSSLLFFPPNSSEFTLLFMCYL